MAGFAFFPPLIESQIFKTLDVTDAESEGYKNFKQPPVPLYMGFNMWHVNNPDDIVNGSTPSFTEIGPFIYREVREKRNIETSADGCSINAAQYKRYDFDMEKTQELCKPKELCGDAKSTHVT